MKYIKKYNESNEKLDIENIREYFAETFDLCNQNVGEEVEIVYFDPLKEKAWASNDFTGNFTNCVEGFELSFYHNFYTTSELSELDNYLKILNQIKEDIRRYKSTFKPSEMFFEDSANNRISLLIRP